MNMTITQFRARFFFALFIVKILVFGWLIFMWSTHGYSFSQLKEIFYIIAPIFTAHLIPAVSFYARMKKESIIDKIEAPPKTLVRISVILLVVYAVYMIVVIALVPGEEHAFSNVKEMLGWAEIIFGVLIGIIISELYSS